MLTVSSYTKNLPNTIPPFKALPSPHLGRIGDAPGHDCLLLIDITTKSQFYCSHLNLVTFKYSVVDNEWIRCLGIALLRSLVWGPVGIQATCQSLWSLSPWFYYRFLLVVESFSAFQLFPSIVNYSNLGNFEYRNSMLKILEVARVWNRIVIMQSRHIENWI